MMPVSDPCPRCGGDHDRIDRRDPCPVTDTDMTAAELAAVEAYMTDRLFNPLGRYQVVVQRGCTYLLRWFETAAGQGSYTEAFQVRRGEHTGRLIIVDAEAFDWGAPYLIVEAH